MRLVQCELACDIDEDPLQVEGRAGLEAWAAWLDDLGVAHSGVQSQTKPFIYSTLVFRDIDNIELEFVAADA